MIETYFTILLGLLIFIGIFSIIFSICIFFPRKKKIYTNTYKQEYYGNYYKEPTKLNYGEIIANLIKYFERK